MSSCWDYILNAYLCEIAEKEGLSIIRIPLKDRKENDVVSGGVHGYLSDDLLRHEGQG